MVTFADAGRGTDGDGDTVVLLHVSGIQFSPNLRNFMGGSLELDSSGLRSLFLVLSASVTSKEEVEKEGLGLGGGGRLTSVLVISDRVDLGGVTSPNTSDSNASSG